MCDTPDWDADWASNVKAHALSRSGMPLIVQFGSECCALCPQATLDMDLASKSYAFKWMYEDATTSILAEELQVTALPALFVFHDQNRYKLYEKLRGTNIVDVIKQHCSPLLVLDEEF